jgi:hypothetical protein
MALTTDVISAGISAQAAKQGVNRFRKTRVKACTLSNRQPKAPAILNGA